MRLQVVGRGGEGVLGVPDYSDLTEAMSSNIFILTFTKAILKNLPLKLNRTSC